MTENKGTIVIVCSGSRGDVQPFIPIAMRLKRYGYGVNFIAYESFRTFLKSYGFTDEEFTPFVGSMVEALQSKEGQEALARGDMMGIMKIVQKLLPFQPRNDDIMIEACSKSDVKALLCSTVVLNQVGSSIVII
jgi:sterol 3beta-glucosyltransferase